MEAQHDHMHTKTVLWCGNTHLFALTLSEHFAALKIKYIGGFLRCVCTRSMNLTNKHKYKTKTHMHNSKCVTCKRWTCVCVSLQHVVCPSTCGCVCVELCVSCVELCVSRVVMEQIWQPSHSGHLTLERLFLFFFFSPQFFFSAPLSFSPSRD